MPLHYARLKEGYEKTLKGIGRPWWKIFFGVWKSPTLVEDLFGVWWIHIP